MVNMKRNIFNIFFYHCFNKCGCHRSSCFKTYSKKDYFFTWIFICNFYTIKWRINKPYISTFTSCSLQTSFASRYFYHITKCNQNHIFLHTKYICVIYSLFWHNTNRTTRTMNKFYIFR